MLNIYKLISSILLVMTFIFSEEQIVPLPGETTTEPLITHTTTNNDSSIPLPGNVANLSKIASIINKIKFSGYIESTISASFLRDNKSETLLNNNKFRFNIFGKPEKFIDFNISLTGIFFAGANSYNIYDYLPDNSPTIRTIPADFLTYTFEPEIKIEEAFGTLNIPNFLLRIGRQKLYTGTGYAFNPTDLLNKKDPLDPTYETTGIDALYLLYKMPKSLKTEAVIKFSDRFKTSAYRVKIAKSIKGFTVSIHYTKVDKNILNWEKFNTDLTIATNQIPINDFLSGGYNSVYRQQMPALDFVGNIGNIGIYGEGGYSWIKQISGTIIENRAKDHLMFLLGFNYTFNFQLSIMGEYLYLGLGNTTKNNITFNERMELFSGDILSTSRDTIFVGFDFPLGPFINYSTYSIVAINDKSAIVIPRLLFDVTAGMKLELYGNIALGDENSQNGKMGGSCFLRFKYSF